jgi:hypothetical protein
LSYRYEAEISRHPSTDPPGAPAPPFRGSGWRLDLSALLQTIQPPKDASDVGSLDLRCATIAPGTAPRPWTLLDCGARRVAEKPKFSLDVVDAPGELRVLRKPTTLARGRVGAGTDLLAAGVAGTNARSADRRGGVGGRARRRRGGGTIQSPLGLGDYDEGDYS